MVDKQPELLNLRNVQVKDAGLIGRWSRL